MHHDFLIHRRALDLDEAVVYDLYMEPAANPMLTYDLMDRDAFTEIYQQLLKTKELFVCEWNGDVVATYRLHKKQHRQAHVVYLGGFSIHPDHRGKGWGTQILTYIKQLATVDGKGRIELSVDIDNHPALALYKRIGFEIEGIAKRNYKRSDTGLYYDEYVMSLML